MRILYKLKFSWCAPRVRTMENWFGNFAISYFDLRIGPKLLLSESEQLRNDRIFEDRVSKLIDLHRSGDFFFHYFQGQLTFNLVFSLHSPGTRGNQFDLMATFVIPNADDGASVQRYFLKMGMIEEKLRKTVYQLSKERILFDLIEAAHSDAKIYEKLYENARQALIFGLKRTELCN